jgi:8-oxo-dGTP diphosphatase
VRVVVGAALVHGGRVLAARRSAPSAVAGGWEFPGGKVEDDEDEPSALVRECREELGVEVRPLRRLDGEQPLNPGYVLRVWVADLVAGDPEPLEDHDELRWLGPDELDAVAWLAADEPFLAPVAQLLAGSGRTPARTMERPPTQERALPHAHPE